MTTRRKLLFGVGSLALAAAADVVVVEPRWLRVETHRIPVLGGKFARPVRLVQLSDLHYSWCVSADLIARSFRMALDQKPDLVCLTGDFVTLASTVEVGVLTELVKELSSRVPTYAVKGNHDGGAWSRLYMHEPDDHGVAEAVVRGGVKLLHNQSERIRLHGGEFWLAGVGDLWSKDVVAHQAFGGVPGGEKVVLMAHNPDTKDVVERGPWSLMLSGHTHGTQTSVPGVRERFAPVVDKRFIAGLMRWEETGKWIHVNRGVGNLGGFRVLCPPEVSVLELV